MITSLHVMTGAFTLALSLVLTLASRTLAWKRSRAAQNASLIEVAA
jgi:hypothetical protein